LSQVFLLLLLLQVLLLLLLLFAKETNISKKDKITFTDIL
jgi:hypothetical protein